MRSMTWPLVAGVVGAFPRGAEAADPPHPAPGTVEDRPVSARSIPLPTRSEYVHTLGAVTLGRGLRFNNPYRLQTQLGDDAEGLSLTASYLDLGLGATLGDPRGLQHGAVTHLSLALGGVGQEVLSLSYLALHPFGPDLLGYARAGFPVVFQPDLTGGFEIGAGGLWFLSGGLGLTAELVSSLFMGAATWEHEQTLIPILSLQVGGFVDYEVLP